MDGGGRFLRSLRARLFAPLALARPHVPSFAFVPGAPLEAPFPEQSFAPGSQAPRAAPTWIHRQAHPLARTGVGSFALLFGFCATLALGLVHSGAYAEFVTRNGAPHETLARLFGFPIESVTISGQVRLRENEILAATGVDAHSSLLFLDADAARARLLANPRIGEANVLKLYPDRLQITITERQAFALWQKDGHVSVIADDGTVLEAFSGQYAGLPLVVGKGAERQAKDFLAVVDHYPEIRSAIRASIMVAQRRWNLRLTNGIDVALPEGNVESALQRLVALDREKKLLSRDVTLIDLRISDRVTVRLSPAAFQAREEELKDSAKKKKGGSA